MQELYMHFSDALRNAAFLDQTDDAKMKDLVEVNLN